MKIFEKLKKIPNEKLHPKFKLLRDELYYRGAREVLEKFTEGFVDRDQKIIEEFQTTFHSSFWEFYLHAVFSELGFKVDYSYDRPDFIIKNPSEFYVEAVVSQIKDNGRGEHDRNLDDHLSMLSPISTREEFSEIIDEAITRHSNSVQSKYKKYKEYTKCAWVDSEKPYIVALGSYDQVNYGREYIYSMMALLYNAYYCPETEAYYKIGKIKKPNSDADINLGIFLEKRFEDISAIIFSSTVTLGKLTSLSKSFDGDFNQSFVMNVRHDTDHPHYKIQEVSESIPEELTDGLFIFHNPNAKNKLSTELFSNSNIVQYQFENNIITMQGGHLPLVARYCSPTLLVPPMIKNLYIMTAASNYNKLGL